MPLIEQAMVANRQRARAHKAHLAAQHVDHIRHLVEREPPQDPPDGRHPRVFADLEECALCLVQRLQLGLALRRVDVHRPELEQAELGFVEAHTPVAVEDRPARGRLDRGGDREPER